MNLRTLSFTLLALAAPAAIADNCGSEEDCRAVPQNVDAATGIAAAGAAAAVLIGVAGSGRRHDPDPAVTFDPAANAGEPEETPPEEGTGSTGSVEDLFGEPSGETPPDAEAPPEGPPDDTPPPEDPTRGGPPDGPLGDPDDLG